MPAAEFNLWAAYYRAAPWGDYRADLRAGIISATVANVQRDPKSKPFVPVDFMPFEQRPPPPPVDIEANIELFMRKYN